MMRTLVNIWNFQLPDHGKAIIEAAIKATDLDDLKAIFEQAGSTGTTEHDDADLIADARARIAGLNLPEEVKAGLLAQIDDTEDWNDDDDWDGEDLDDVSFLLSLISTPLAESHMFFDDPYASLDYDVRNEAIDSQFSAYETIISGELGQNARSLSEAFSLSAEKLLDNDEYIFESPVGYTLGERVALWPTTNGTWFLGAQQEDKELPIFIIFGKFDSADHAALGAHLKGFAQ